MKRERWQGWTLVYKDGGDLVLQDSVPILFTSKQQAAEQKEIDEQAVRCEVRLIKKGPPLQTIGRAKLPT